MMGKEILCNTNKRNINGYNNIIQLHQNKEYYQYLREKLDNNK